MTEYDDYGIPVGAYQEPEGLLPQTWRTMRAFYLYRLRPLAISGFYEVMGRDWTYRKLFTFTNALVVLWWVVLYWGESGVFNGNIESCSWDKWEKWEAGANPHRLIFVADPQLIDPHTYPGRPWPINPLAYKYTDLYLRRTYSRLQTVLYPDTIFFLGDLFDGGREWSTLTTTSPEKQYRKYDNEFWLNEYRRFGNIFFGHWADAGLEPRPGQQGRKIISSLPGNHDLGFARGVQVGVRNRFNAYFGDGNRIDIIANHTFVSIDSLSLSALGQDSPEQVKDLWQPTTDFLEKAKTQKTRLVQRELRRQQGLHPYPPFTHHPIEAPDLPSSTLPHSDAPVTDFPTILLSHIPLYRAPGTPCGPLREHWPPTPPSSGQPPLESDDRNAISVSGGYQYQNVLNREITVDVANKIGDIRYAFSGDDHDYCSVLHRSYASGGGGIAEITVKSTSWAMGVRHPGVVLASLWNPVDEHGKPLNGADQTVQTHLCLFPDQIGTFITYGMFFGLTAILLVLHAAMVSRTPQRDAAPMLPTSTQDTQREEMHSSQSSSASERGNVWARAQGRNGGKYAYPQAGYYADDEEKEKKVKVYGSAKKGKKSGAGAGGFVGEVKRGLGRVVVCAGVWYLVLVWRDRN